MEKRCEFFKNIPDIAERTIIAYGSEKSENMVLILDTYDKDKKAENYPYFGLGQLGKGIEYKCSEKERDNYE